MTAPAAADVARARALVMAHGWNATAFQIVNPGFHHWFSRRHEAVAGYVRCHDVRLVAGSPVAPLASLDAVVDEFEADARAAGDTVCYFGAERRLQGVAAARGRYAHVVLGAQLQQLAGLGRQNARPAPAPDAAGLHRPRAPAVLPGGDEVIVDHAAIADPLARLRLRIQRDHHHGDTYRGQSADHGTSFVFASR